MEDVQLTILGPSGTGKTCFLLGMYSELSAGKGGFSLSTDDDNDVKFRNLYGKICDVKLGKERFPAGTSTNSIVKFTLYYAYRNILDFRWLDYSGDALINKFEGDYECYEEIKEVIDNSTCLLMCVDGELLCEDDETIVIQNLRDKIVSVVNFFLSKYVDRNKLLPPIVFVVTKYDLCSSFMPKETLYKVIKNAFNSIFVAKNQVVTIVPVSIGKYIGKEDSAGIFRPVCMDLPIFFGAWFVMKERLKGAIRSFLENDEKCRSLKNELSKCENSKKEEQDKRWFFRSSGKIQELSRKCEELRRKIEHYKDVTYMLIDDIEVLCDNKAKLANSLKEEGDMEFFFSGKDGCLLDDIDPEFDRLFEKYEDCKSK